MSVTASPLKCSLRRCGEGTITHARLARTHVSLALTHGAIHPNRAALQTGVAGPLRFYEVVLLTRRTVFIVVLKLLPTPTSYVALVWMGVAYLTCHAFLQVSLPPCAHTAGTLARTCTHTHTRAHTGAGGGGNGGGSARAARALRRSRSGGLAAIASYSLRTSWSSCSPPLS